MADPLSQGPMWVPNTPFESPSDPKVARVPTPGDAFREGSKPLVPTGTTSYPDPLQSALKTRVVPSISPLRTYQSDLAEAMKAQNTTAIKMVASEQDRRARVMPRDPNEVPTPKSVPKIVFVVAIVLVVSGVLFFGYALFVRFAPTFTFFSKSPTPVENPDETPNTNVVNTQRRISNPLVSAEVSYDISVTEKTSLSIATALNAYRSEPGFVRLDLFKGATSEPLVSSEIISQFSRNALPELIRSFEPRFAFGYFGGGESDAYLILTTRSYSQTFAGMLSWEKDLVRDVGRLLMTREREDEYRARLIETKSTLFVDETLSNKDVRIARDTNGRAFLLYGFLDNETLVITTSENAFVEVMDRVRTARIIR